MSSAEIAEIKKLIKDIRYKLNEIEKTISKNPKDKNNYPVNNQVYSPRKRNPYRSTE